MQTKALSFFSDGLRLDGILYSPDATAAERLPVIVVCSGLHGVKEWVPARWAPFFVAAGFHCFGFDYRGFGSSEGERGRMIPDEEIRDSLSALAFLRGREEVDPEAIALLGWGLGGGIAIETAARDPGVRAVCCANGAGDYGRTARDAVEYRRWLDWKDRLARDRIERAKTGRSEMVDYRNITNPGSVEAYEDRNQFYKDLGWIGQSPIGQFTLETCEAYMAFRPEDTVARIAPRPLLIVHGEKNYFMPIDEAHRLYERAKEPKTLRVIRGDRHLEMIDPDNPASAATMRGVADWFGAILRPAPPAAAVEA